MEPSTHSTNSKAWLFFTASTIGMVIFAALYFFNPRTLIQTETNTVATTVTNEVLKGVPRVIKTTVTVTNPIPESYILSSNFLSNYINATVIEEKDALFSMNDVQVIYTMDNTAKEVISEDAVRAKFELTLRRNSVPIDSKSRNYMFVTIEGFWADSNSTSPQLFVYLISVHVNENQPLFRGGQCYSVPVTIWRKGYYGLARKATAAAALLEQVEQQAELFANDFLSANPKPK